MTILSVNRHVDKDLESAVQTQCMDTIGKRISKRRKDLGLSQVDLATSVGIKQNTLSGIETDKTKEMEATTLAGLCRELRLTPEYIVFGIGASDVAELAVLESEMTYIIRSISPEQRAMLLGMARGAYDQARGESVSVEPKRLHYTPKAGDNAH